MTGPWDGCLGRDKNAVLQKFLDGRPRAFAVAENDVHICGCIVEIDETAKKPVSIKSFIFPNWNEPMPITPQKERELKNKQALENAKSAAKSAPAAENARDTRCDISAQSPIARAIACLKKILLKKYYYKK